MPLFRSESEEARASAWLGRILLIRPVSFTFLTAGAFTVALLIAAFFISGEYTRKARVTGVLAPTTGVVKVVAQQSGVVEDLRVAEGATVEERQPLFSLADPRSRDSLESVGSTVEARIGERRRAIAMQRDHVWNALQTEQAALAHRAAGMERELAQIDTEMEIQSRRLAVAQQGADRWLHLRSTGFASPAAADREREQALEHESRLEASRRTRMTLARELASVRMESVGSHARGLAQLSSIDSQAAALEQERVERGAQHRIAIVSPVRGTVATVLVEPGQTVMAGATLATVIPADARLEAHLFAPSRSIGFVRSGQEVLVRYLAYPHQKFGSHTARVAVIARNPLTPAELGFAPLDGSREPLYRIRIALDSQTITAYGKQEPLQPGMQVEADILLDRRRLIEWVFEPLISLAGRA